MSQQRRLKKGITRVPLLPLMWLYIFPTKVSTDKQSSSAEYVMAKRKDCEIFSQAHDGIHVLTTAICFIVKVSRQHLFPVSICSIQDCKSTNPDSFDRECIISHWQSLNESLQGAVIGPAFLLFWAFLPSFTGIPRQLLLVQLRDVVRIVAYCSEPSVSCLKVSTDVVSSISIISLTLFPAATT